MCMGRSGARPTSILFYYPQKYIYTITNGNLECKSIEPTGDNKVSAQIIEHYVIKTYEGVEV
jgi:hypothetical protein